VLARKLAGGFDDRIFIVHIHIFVAAVLLDECLLEQVVGALGREIREAVIAPFPIG